MSAVEEIRAAIERLTELKANTTAGPWLGWRQYNPLKGTKTGIEAHTIEVAATYSMPDTELIEVLHATIDAQSAVMRNFAEVYGESKTPNGYAQSILTLARAINGAAS